MFQKLPPRIHMRRCRMDRVSAEIYENSPAVSVYLRHLCNLGVSFTAITLVNTDVINPHPCLSTPRPKMFQHIPAVLRLNQDIPVWAYEDGLGERPIAILTSPCVRRCIVLTIRTVLMNFKLHVQRLISIWDSVKPNGAELVELQSSLIYWRWLEVNRRLAGVHSFGTVLASQLKRWDRCRRR